MPRWLMFVLFFTVFAVVLGGFHYYLYRRIRFAFKLENKKTLRRIKLGLLFLGVSYPVSRGLLHAWYCGFTVGFYWFACIWLGLAVYLILFTCLFHLVSGLCYKVAWVRAQRTQLGFWFGALILSLAMAGWGLVEAWSGPRVTRVEVSLKQLPDYLDGFKIVQLSDLHAGAIIGSERLSEIVSVVNRLSPDLVVITGDLVDQETENFLKVQEPLSRLKSNNGVFAVTGNHEFFAGVETAVRYAEKAGIRFLRNESHRLVNDIWLYGVDDRMAARFGQPPPPLDEIITEEAKDRLAILLYHQPRDPERFFARGINLMLSGHTHRGQMMPFHWLSPLVFPHDHGLYVLEPGMAVLNVSVGTGTWGPPMRAGIPPEVVELVLRKYKG